MTAGVVALDKEKPNKLRMSNIANEDHDTLSKERRRTSDRSHSTQHEHRRSTKMEQLNVQNTSLQDDSNKPSVKIRGNSVKSYRRDSPKILSNTQENPSEEHRKHSHKEISSGHEQHQSLLDQKMGYSLNLMETEVLEEEATMEDDEEVEDNNIVSGGSEFILNRVTFDWQNEADPLTIFNEQPSKKSETNSLFQTESNVTQTNKLELSKEKDKQQEKSISEQPELLKFNGHKPTRRTKEWLVFCGKTQKTKPTFKVTLSPQTSESNFEEEKCSLNATTSEPNNLSRFDSVKTLRGSTIQGISVLPSSFTIQSTTLSRFNKISCPSLTESDPLTFDLADEPIWQRGRHFDHPSDLNRKHFITIINTINYDIKVMEATQGTLLKDIKDRYKQYNSNIENYIWKDVYEKLLNFQLNLHQNGLVDNSYITDEIGLNYYPLILLFFDDGYQNDPPMQLDIGKAFIRDKDLLCRNYALGLIPHENKIEIKKFTEKSQLSCKTSQMLQTLPSKSRNKFTKCSKGSKQKVGEISMKSFATVTTVKGLENQNKNSIAVDEYLKSSSNIKEKIDSHQKELDQGSKRSREESRVKDLNHKKNSTDQQSSPETLPLPKDGTDSPGRKSTNRKVEEDQQVLVQQGGIHKSQSKKGSLFNKEMDDSKKNSLSMKSDQNKRESIDNKVDRRKNSGRPSDSVASNTKYSIKKGDTFVPSAIMRELFGAEDSKSLRSILLAQNQDSNGPNRKHDSLSAGESEKI